MQLFAKPIILLFIAYFISALYLIVYDCPIQQGDLTCREAEWFLKAPLLSLLSS